MIGEEGEGRERGTEGCRKGGTKGGSEGGYYKDREGMVGGRDGVRRGREGREGRY